MPSRMEIGIETITARTIPGMPTICQSETRIRAISAAMAPSVIPKFRPMPAMMGISRLRIRKELRPIRVTISLTSIFAESPEIGIQIAQMIMNMIGTDACLRIEPQSTEAVLSFFVFI